MQSEVLIVTDASPTAPELTCGEKLFLPSVGRVEEQVQSIAPYAPVHVLGTDVSALIDTGGSLSLIGDAIFELCLAGSAKLRKCSSRLQVANGAVQARSAAHLHIFTQTEGSASALHTSLVWWCT